jgi:hypothetical protein
MIKILAHLIILTKSFVFLYLLSMLLVALVVAAISFVVWAIPSIPSFATLLFSARVLAALSALVTLAYSFSDDYKESLVAFLSR